MEKEKLHKRIIHKAKKKSALWWTIGLIFVGGVFLINHQDALPFSPEEDAWEELAHDGYEEPDPEDYKEATIKIKDGKFVPEKLEVAAGTLILFENEDNEPHTATSDNFGSQEDINFDTGILPHEKKIPTVEYGIPGTYNYHDKLHPEIKGVIVVK